MTKTIESDATGECGLQTVHIPPSAGGDVAMSKEVGWALGGVEWPKATRQ